MEIVNCQIRGQVSQDSLYWMRDHRMDKHGPGWEIMSTVHLTRHLFLVFVRTHTVVSHDIGSSVCARHLIHVSCAWVFDLSSTLSSHSSFVSPIFYFILLIFYFLFHVDVAWARSLVHFAEWGVWPFGQQRPSHRLTRKQTTSRPDNVWPDMWKHMSDASKRKERQKWAIEKPRQDNARRLRCIFCIDPDDDQFKHIKPLNLSMRISRTSLKNARRKLEIPMPAAMPCILQLHKHRETCCTVGQNKTKYACIVEADESVGIRMEGSQSKTHEDHIAGRGMNSLSHYDLVHKFIPMPQAMKNTRSKGSSGERIGKIEQCSMAADESQEQKWRDRWSKEHKPYCSFCVVNGSWSSQDFGVGTTISKIQRSSRAPR